MEELAELPQRARPAGCVPSGTAARGTGSIPSRRVMTPALRTGSFTSATG
jgi:hypothetical protein